VKNISGRTAIKSLCSSATIAKSTVFHMSQQEPIMRSIVPPQDTEPPHCNKIFVILSIPYVV